MGSLEVNDFTAGIMKSVENMEHLSGRVIKARGGSSGICVTRTSISIQLGLPWLQYTGLGLTVLQNDYLCHGLKWNSGF